MPPEQNTNLNNPFRDKDNKQPEQPASQNIPQASVAPWTPQSKNEFTPSQSTTRPIDPRPDPFAPSQQNVFQPLTQTQQPIQPSAPQFSQPTPESNSTNNKPKRTLVIFAAIAGLLLLAGIAAAYLLFFSQKTPDEAFRATLENSLSTSSLSQTTSSTEPQASATIDYDLKNIKDPKVSTNFSFSSNGASIKLQGYGTFKSSYAKVSEFNGLQTLPEAGKNKWIQIKKDGAIAENASPLDTFYTMYDPNYVTLGQYIYGNFSSQDRKTLVDYVVKERVYEYDAKTVKKEQLDGRQVYVYSVQTSAEKLATYNKKAGEIMGMSNASIESALGLMPLSNSLKATLYIDPKAAQLIKVVADDGSKTTTVYSKWNQVSIPAEPKADYQYEDFLKLSAAPVQPTQIPSVVSRAKDTQRQTDILALAAHIEAYYAENGVYPTLDDLNNPSWRSTNLHEIAASAFDDPDGQTKLLSNKPSVGIYSYEAGATKALSGCDNITNNCNNFRLTATLSDGKRYTKESLN